jgi:hypothetical protein
LPNKLANGLVDDMFTFSCGLLCMEVTGRLPKAGILDPGQLTMHDVDQRNPRKYSQG